MSVLSTRECFVDLLRHQKTILEIGPFCNPIVSGKNVVYFDVLDGDGLKQRAEAIGYPVAQVPKIQYVSPTGDLSIIDQLFPAVISSHCIEHTPDLVRHLQQVGEILGADGYYFLIIPDKRYCFDYTISESTIASVIDAHIEQRCAHRAASVIEHLALTTHNDSGRHWSGDHFNSGYRETMASRTMSAVRRFELAKGDYIDVHAWQFTPGGFRELLEKLFDLKYSPLKPIRVYNTPQSRLEFCAILQKKV